MVKPIEPWSRNFPGRFLNFEFKSFNNSSWPYAEKKNEGMTRDACTQSGTLPSISSSNPSTNLTPSMVEMSTNDDSQNSDDNQTKFEEEVSDKFFSS